MERLVICNWGIFADSYRFAKQLKIAFLSNPVLKFREIKTMDYTDELSVIDECFSSLSSNDSLFIWKWRDINQGYSQWLQFVCVSLKRYGRECVCWWLLRLLNLPSKELQLDSFVRALNTGSIALPRRSLTHTATRIRADQSVPCTLRNL